MTDKKSLLSAIIAGAAVGTAAGVLIAPKPGKVTRRYIGSQAGKTTPESSTRKDPKIGPDKRPVPDWPGPVGLTPRRTSPIEMKPHPGDKVGFIRSGPKRLRSR